MHCRAVIFDLDGTLADTLEDIADNMNRVLAGKGIPVHGYDRYRFFVGNGLKNLVTQSLPEEARTEAFIAGCHEEMMAGYHAHYICKTRLYDGIPALLDALSSRSVPWAVLSNKADSLTQKICHALLEKWKFEIIMGAGDRFPRKPDPASALFIAEVMNVPPSEICFLGDSDVDMKTALAAGFYPVGVGWGFRPKEELVTSGAKYIIDHPMELLTLF